MKKSKKIKKKQLLGSSKPLKILRKLRKKQKVLNKILIFLLVFNLLAIPMYLIIYFDLDLFALKYFIALIVYNIFKTFGYNVHLLSDASINFLNENIIAEISTDSTGWKSLYALFSLILAANFSKNLKVKFSRKEIKFLALSLLSIFIINIFRIVTTIYFTLKFGLVAYEFFHTILWREMMIFFVVIFFYFYINKFIR